MENVTEQNKEVMSQKPGATCPAAMEMLKTDIICCLPDEELTFQWGNPSFFSSIG